MDKSLSFLLVFNFFNGNISQNFYFSLVSSYVFKRYILSNLKNYYSGEKIILKNENILEYDLDGSRNITFLSIYKDIKFISDNVLKSINTLKKIKINA